MFKSKDALNIYYKKIFDDFPALIWRSGLDMKCSYFNNTWLEFTGRSLEQELGDGWTEGVHPDDLSSCVATYVENFKIRKPFDMLYRLKNRDGEYRWIRDIGRPFFDHRNCFLGYIGSCYDCTDERDRQERLNEINQAKDKFFSILAHDLVGPITAIESLTSMLEHDFSSYDQETLALLTHELSQAATHVTSFLSEILDWARSQLQGVVVEPARWSLAELAAQAISPLEETARMKQVSVRTSIDRALFVYADADMIKTVIRNLVANAIKFTYPRKGIDIRGATEEGMVTMSVSDVGIGMDDEQLASIFTLEKKKRRQGTEGENGSGLGLLICKEFVEKNGGSIRAESIQGEGSTFTFSLPA